MAKITKDMPDNYQWLPGSTRYPLADLGEVAARLGSPITYDRRGEVLWYTQFRDGIQQFTVLGETANDYALVDPNVTYRSPYAIKLIANGVAASFVEILKYFSPATLGRAGLEIACQVTTSFNYVLVQLRHYTGTAYVMGELKFRFTQADVQIRQSSGVYLTVMTGVNLYANVGEFYNLKLVVDFDTGFYTRALMGEQVADLSAYALYTTASAATKKHFFAVLFQPVAATALSARVGEIILTGNEP